MNREELSLYTKLTRLEKEKEELEKQIFITKEEIRKDWESYMDRCDKEHKEY